MVVLRAERAGSLQRGSLVLQRGSRLPESLRANPGHGADLLHDRRVRLGLHPGEDGEHSQEGEELGVHHHGGDRPFPYVREPGDV